MIYSLLRLSCRKMGARPGLDLILHRNGLILRQYVFQVIKDENFLEEGECYGRKLYLPHNLQVYIQSLTTASGSRLFCSVVEHWIIDPAARFRFTPKSWDFFHPNLLCFVLCYDFHVVRLFSQNLSHSIWDIRYFVERFFVY